MYHRDGTIDRRALLAGALALAGGMVAAAPAIAAASTRFPPRVRRLAPGFDRIVAPGTAVETIATDIRWAEGPVWVERGSYLLFSDPPANVVRQWRRGGKATPFLSPSGAAGTDPRQIREPGANGLALDASGQLLIANSGGRSIDRLDLITRRRTIVADRFRGKRFNSPNDMHVARNGAIYFTDPPYGLAAGDTSPLKEIPFNGVYRWSAHGGVELLDDQLTFPNGIALSPDERRLYVSVSDETAPRIVAYDVDAKGRVSGSRVWLDAAAMKAAGGAGLPDGMKIARDGTLICSVPGGMMFLTPEAEPLGIVETGGPIANCAVGEGGRSLFLTADTAVLRLPMRAGWQA